MKSSSRALLAVLCAVLALSLTACSGSDKNATDASREAPGDLSATPSAQVTGTPASDAKVVEITFTGKSVSPKAERVKIALKQPVVLQIKATVAGQLHIHSTPQHTIDFPRGDSEITVSFDDPGVIDMEDHALGTLIAQFEVS
jgi:hypothetical protein